jgi:hypothetical protein
MMRKFLTFFTILLIVFLAYFSYKLLKEKEVAVNSLIDAVPFDANLIIEINRPELLMDILYEPPIDAESFLSIPFINEPLESLRAVDSLTSLDKVARAAIRRPHSAIISGHQVGKGKIEFIYYLKLDDDKEIKTFDKIIKKNTQGRGNISQHSYEDARISDVSFSRSKSAGFSYTYYQGILALSKSSMLVEEVVRQLRSNTSIRSKAGLETVLRTAGKSSPFNIYINFDFFPNLASLLIHKKFQPELEAISKFAHWVELDFNVNNNAIILNGFSSTENATGFLSDIFKDQEPLNLILPGLLPSKTKSFFALGISDYEKFKLNFSEYQREQEDNPDFLRNMNNYGRKTGIDLEKEFTAAFDQEVCFVYYPSSGNSLTNNIITVIKTKGNNEAKGFVETITQENTELPDSLKSTEKELSGTFYNVADYNIPKLLFGNIFGLNKNSFCTISDNYIIFGDSLTNLDAFVKDFSQHESLALDANYKNVSDLLSEDAYCYFYLSPDAEQLYNHYLKFGSDQMRSQVKYGLSQVQAIGYQFGRNNDLFYNNAFILFSTKPTGNITPEWEVQLDDNPATNVYLVKNHINNSSELVCQDKANNLYLISTTGEIIWKRKLNSRIISDIYQADLFTNKKLQLIFNTSNEIVAIDRNGKDIEGFPVKLNKNAIGPMAIFDYDKTRNYRILIPLSDSTLYCLDKKGKEIEGWKKPKIANKPGKIKYYSFDGKDYIVLYDGKSTHFYDRRGQTRIRTTLPVRVAPNSLIYGYASKNSFQFSSTDSSGTIYIVSTNGNVSKVQTGIYPLNHYYFPFDINYDNSMEHVFVYDRKFEAFSNTGERILNQVLDGEVNLPPQIITLSDSTYLYSYTDTVLHQIYLNNLEGESLEGSPLNGNSTVNYEVKNSNHLLNLYYFNNNILICISVK